MRTEETPWIGGQWTSQGVAAPDERPHIEAMGQYRPDKAVRIGIRAVAEIRSYSGKPPIGLNMEDGAGIKLVCKMSRTPQASAARIGSPLAP